MSLNTHARNHLLIFSVSVVLSTACSTTLQVKTEVDEQVDFSKYSTFDFYQIEEEREKMDELSKRRILMAVEQELGKKGIRKSNAPDVIINIYTLVSTTEGRMISNPGGMSTRVGMGGYGGYYGGYGGGFGISYSAPSQTYIKGYRKGQYIVDMVDRSTMQLVLQAVVYAEAQEGNKDQQRRIDYSVQKIFAKIPDRK
jgi:hypothetical protein